MQKRNLLKLKSTIALSLILSMFAGSTLIGNATTLKDVFNPKHYSENYTDLQAAYQEDAIALYQHYITYGLKEGRDMNGFLNLSVYKETYPDLQAVFGDDWNAYLTHYLTYGVKEGRITGTDFNAAAYAERYPDLMKSYGYDAVALYEHYITFGKVEGRNAELYVVTNKTSSSSTTNNTDTTTDNDTDNSTGEDTTTEFRAEYSSYYLGDTDVLCSSITFIGSGDTVYFTYSDDSINWIYYTDEYVRHEDPITGEVTDTNQVTKEYQEPSYEWYYCEELSIDLNGEKIVMIPENKWSWGDVDPTGAPGSVLHLRVYSPTSGLINLKLTFGEGVTVVSDDFTLSEDEIESSNKLREEYSIYLQENSAKIAELLFSL